MPIENVSFLLSAKNLTGNAFNQVRGSLNGLGQQVISVRGIVGGLAAALGVGSFLAGIKAASEAADAAAKMGDRFGIATEKLIGMQHAGDLAGVSQEGLAAAMKGMAKFATDAARGAQEQARSMQMLGLRAEEFIKLPMDRQLSTIIDKLGQVENVTVRNALAQEALGRGAGEMMGLVAEGAEAFAKAAQDAQAWGLAISRVDAAKLEMANDAITRAQAAAKGLFTTIAIYVAPVVKALADYFADSSAEAGGFKKQAGEASEVVITGIGYAANVVQGLRFAYVAVKLVVAEFATAAFQAYGAFLTMSVGIWTFLAKIPGPLGRGAEAVRDFAVNLKEQVGLMAESTASTATTIRQELDAIALEGLPKDKIIAKIREVRALMEKEAVEIARRRQAMMRGGGVDIAQDKAPEKKAVRDTWREQLAAKLERLREENMTELQLLDEKLRERNLLLQSGLEAGLLTEEAAAAQSALVRQQYEAAKTKIVDDETKKRWGISEVYRKLDLESAQAWFGQMASLMQSKSRAMFEVGKAAAISETIIQTYKAAQGAYAAFAQIPVVGPAMGIAAAAAATVAGLARVQQIRSQSFGSGSAAAPVYSASPTTGVPTAPISPLQTSAPAGGGSGVEINVFVINNGTVVGSGGMEQLTEDHIAPALRDLVNDRDFRLIHPGSRQALDIVGAGA